jgi:two-component sensor histidine kinase
MNVGLSLHAPRELRRSLEAAHAGSMERWLLKDLLLCASELVANAVVHSGCPGGDCLNVRATVSDGVLRLEVIDNGAGVRELKPRSTTPPSGLGYLELLTDRWSSYVDNSFHVWFEIDVVVRDRLVWRSLDPVAAVEGR